MMTQVGNRSDWHGHHGGPSKHPYDCSVCHDWFKLSLPTKQEVHKDSADEYLCGGHVLPERRHRRGRGARLAAVNSAGRDCSAAFLRPSGKENRMFIKHIHGADKQRSLQPCVLPY